MKINNISRFYIQHQNTLREYLLTFCYALFVVMCLWAATEAYDWVYMTYLENHRLKSELHEEKTALKVMFVQDAIEGKQKDREREQAIKDLCKRDARGCKIMAAK